MSSPSSAPISSPVLKWLPLELSFTAQSPDLNPYARIRPTAHDDRLRVTFTGLSGPASGKSLSLVGFWDGAQSWIVRFAPPCSGQWRYQTHSSDPGLGAKSGSFSVREWSPDELAANPLGHGFIRVCSSGPRPGRYLEHADGVPFLWIADTWWNFGSGRPSIDSFFKIVDDRARKGFTVGMIYAQGWSDPPLDPASSVLDIDRMKRLDAMVAYANSRGLAVVLLPWWGGKDLRDKVGPDAVRRFARYLVHRFAAFNVLWFLAGEYNMDNYSGLGLSFWLDLGAMFKSEDPYDRALSVHPTPPTWDRGLEASQWSTAEVLHAQPWLDYNQIQLGHGRNANENVPETVIASYAMTPPKPILVTEPWYEFVLDNAPARDVRFAAWASMLSGAPGHTYGGGHVWRAHTPTSPSEAKPWPLDPDFASNTLDYPGAVSISILASFFNSIPWWRLEPHPELVRNYPARSCAAIPGELYIAYLRYGANITFDLSACPATDTFESRWFNPATGESTPGPILHGGKTAFLGAPMLPSFHFLLQQDWVLHITKAN